MGQYPLRTLRRSRATPPLFRVPSRVGPPHRSQGVFNRPGLIRGDGLASLRLAQQRPTCSEFVYTADFGAGERAYPIPKGNGTTERACPQGSPIAGGHIRFKCLPSGLWHITHTCFDCAPESNVSITYKSGLSRHLNVRPGVHGDAIEQPCEFDDGTNFSYGHIKMVCADRAWKVCRVRWGLFRAFAKRHRNLTRR